MSGLERFLVSEMYLGCEQNKNPSACEYKDRTNIMILAKFVHLKVTVS